METTTFILPELDDADAADTVRKVLDRTYGVARVLSRPGRREIYVKHSAAKAPRRKLLELLEGEGHTARVKQG